MENCLFISGIYITTESMQCKRRTIIHHQSLRQKPTRRQSVPTNTVEALPLPHQPASRIICRPMIKRWMNDVSRHRLLPGDLGLKRDELLADKSADRSAQLSQHLGVVTAVQHYDSFAFTEIKAVSVKSSTAGCSGNSWRRPCAAASAATTCRSSTNIRHRAFSQKRTPAAAHANCVRSSHAPCGVRPTCRRNSAQ